MFNVQIYSAHSDHFVAKKKELAFIDKASSQEITAMWSMTCCNGQSGSPSTVNYSYYLLLSITLNPAEGWRILRSCWSVRDLSACSTFKTSFTRMIEPIVVGFASKYRVCILFRKPSDLSTLRSCLLNERININLNQRKSYFCCRKSEISNLTEVVQY